MAWQQWPIEGWGIALYVTIVTILWPISVILVSLPLGQFRFFKGYLSRVFTRLTGKKGTNKDSERLAIFASGSGSNALQLMRYFEHHPQISVALVVCNNPAAGVLAHAQNCQIPVLMVKKEHFFTDTSCLAELRQAGITAIALAGFLWRIPVGLVNAYDGKIINIHPALLPKHGGKGMYGRHVHEAVLNQGDPETGITIHVVDAQYDHGPHLFSATCPVLPNDTVGQLAQRVLALEHKHYAPTIENWLLAKP